MNKRRLPRQYQQRSSGNTMIEPHEINEISKIHADDNIKFRTFLKTTPTLTN